MVTNAELNKKLNTLKRDVGCLRNKKKSGCPRSRRRSSKRRKSRRPSRKRSPYRRPSPTMKRRCMEYVYENGARRCRKYNGTKKIQREVSEERKISREANEKVAEEDFSDSLSGMFGAGARRRRGSKRRRSSRKRRRSSRKRRRSSPRRRKSRRSRKRRSRKSRGRKRR